MFRKVDGVLARAATAAIDGVSSPTSCRSISIPDIELCDALADEIDKPACINSTLAPILVKISLN